jgi:hypothetical protein
MRPQPRVRAERMRSADRRPGKAPLSDVRRAARLGLIPVDRLLRSPAAAGYTDDDIAIESDLLAAEIADVAARQGRGRAATRRPLTARSRLEQIAAASRRRRDDRMTTTRALSRSAEHDDARPR